MPEARQSNSKLADMLARASNFRALVGMAVDVVGLFMALLSFVESSTPSLSAQGEQRRSAFFNIRRDIGVAGEVKHCDPPPTVSAVHSVGADKPWTPAAKMAGAPSNGHMLFGILHTSPRKLRVQ